MKIIAAYHKAGLIAYASHLDMQRTLQRTFRRAQIPLSYSQGFNPHPLLSFASALATGHTSDCEWFEVGLEERVEAGDFEARVNACAPAGLWVSNAFYSEAPIGTLSRNVRQARYFAYVCFEGGVELKRVGEAVEKIMAEPEILILKKTKGGIKPVDIRSKIFRVDVEKIGETVVRFDILGELNAAGGLRVEPFLLKALDGFEPEPLITVHRAAMYFEGGNSLPYLP
ncbi:MAG: TIGR03936 family radical SAM-associated protein [Clostridia bacterium]|nr:TIGR03936 family radical SAM-associated protein [Clostridia bacterium]